MTPIREALDKATVPRINALGHILTDEGRIAILAAERDFHAAAGALAWRGLRDIARMLGIPAEPAGDVVERIVARLEPIPKSVVNRPTNCNSCAYDNGRVCDVVAKDDNHQLTGAVLSWVRRSCDAETLRPLNGATGCPAYKPAPATVAVVPHDASTEVQAFAAEVAAALGEGENDVAPDAAGETGGVR